MYNDIDAIKSKALQEVGSAKDISELEQIRTKYLGRKGLFLDLFKQLKDMPQDEKPAFGEKINYLKQTLTQAVEERAKMLGENKPQETVDISADALEPLVGGEHILSSTLKDICSVFSQMGFEIVQSPEVESEFNNFTGLNIDLNHPSRDTFDTFYLDKKSKDGQKLLLRSHTSPGQIRVMKEHKPPLAVVIPGKVYRPDATDASHSFMFHQVEGFLVDENISFANLKAVLEAFLKKLFGSGIRMRLRPHFFPFTEPSAEVDVACFKCKDAVNEHCSVCHGNRWLEILGAGMIHPAVFKNVGYPKNKFSGFAFGMGVERIAILKYAIPDIRMFFENDIRFLKQFS